MMINCFFFNGTATTEIFTLSLHDALPISRDALRTTVAPGFQQDHGPGARHSRSLQARPFPPGSGSAFPSTGSRANPDRPGDAIGAVQWLDFRDPEELDLRIRTDAFTLSLVQRIHGSLGYPAVDDSV